MNKREPKVERAAALELVERHIRESDIAPGFDYGATVLKLRTKFSDDEIALACSVTKNAIGAWAKGPTIPRHDAGERLYILYAETFGEKPPFNKPNKLGD